MRPRIGFVIEQALGHVAYGLGLRKALASRQDMECLWLDIPYDRGRFGRFPALGANWTLRGSQRAYRAIRQLRQQGPLDALFIHTQTIGLFSGGHMAEVPTLLSLDATPINYDELAHHYGDRVHPRPIERAKLLAHRAVIKRVKSFTTWSQWAKDSLSQDYGAPVDKISVIHPGTVLSNYPLPADRPPRTPGPLRILFVGGDFVRKGGDLLLDVCKNELAQRVELHLVTGADVTPGNGVFVYKGLKPHSPELLRRYAEADVFVLPTRGDCLAVVLGEAMASCLPIITTRVGAHPEAVEEGKSGFILEVDDRAALVERLTRFANSPELARSMGLYSRSVGEERFDMHKNANRIADQLLALCTGATR